MQRSQLPDPCEDMRSDSVMIGPVRFRRLVVPSSVHQPSVQCYVQRQHRVDAALGCVQELGIEAKPTFRGKMAVSSSNRPKKRRSELGFEPSEVSEARGMGH